MGGSITIIERVTEVAVEAPAPKLYIEQPLFITFSSSCLMHCEKLGN
jgi:hypothetical protein